MSNRWLRFGIALLAIGAAAAAGYRIFQQEQRLAAGVASSRGVAMLAESAVLNLAELKAAMHAYVAEGQGDAFWTARAAVLIEDLRATILDLDPAATAAGIPLTDTLDQIDRLAAAERRARDHVHDGQRLLAGEVIFIEARDVADTIRQQVVAARSAVADTTGRAQAEVQSARTVLSLAAGGVLAFATLLLVVPGGAASNATAPPGVAHSTVADEGMEANARGASGTPAEGGATATVRTPPASGARSRPVPSATPDPLATAARDRVAGTAMQIPSVSLRDAAAVCTDFGRVSQSIEISGLLQRAANVLNATGAIVWIATPDREELYSAASAGYDDRLLARIGTIARSASNVTAAAFRDASPRTSAQAGLSAAALAVPLMTPLGPVGVFTAEIRDVTSVDETRLAVASMFAAQLAALLGSMASPVDGQDVTATPAARAAGAQA